LWLFTIKGEQNKIDKLIILIIFLMGELCPQIILIKECKIQSTLDIVNTICSSILFTISRSSLYQEWSLVYFRGKYYGKCSLNWDVHYMKYSLYRESTVFNLMLYFFCLSFKQYFINELKLNFLYDILK